MSFSRQRGVALVLVLWFSVLLAIIIGSFAVVARTETMQSAQLYQGLKARLAAEAGLHRAIYELRNPAIELRWFADGRPYRIDFDEMEVTVKVQDESGKIDINLVSDEQLAALLASVGVPEEEVDLLVDAVMDWKDPDDLVRINGAEDDDYRAAGYPYGAKDAPFDTVGELQQVMGMNWELFQKLEPAITIHAGRPQPELAFAPVEVLRTIEGITDEGAQQFISDREQINEFGVPLAELPDGSTPVTRSGGYTFTITSEVELDSGVKSAIEATVRMGGLPNEPPFRVLRWKEG